MYVNILRDALNIIPIHVFHIMAHAQEHPFDASGGKVAPNLHTVGVWDSIFSLISDSNSIGSV